MLLHQQCSCDRLNNTCSPNQNPQKAQLLRITLALLTLFFIAEWGVGLWSHSLSLRADAGHMFADVAAVFLSLIAAWFAQRPANGKATFGYSRVETLAALFNGISLLFIAIFISAEAINHWQNPDNILSLPMLGIAVLGLIVNLLNIVLLHPHSHDDLNLRGALLHIISDTASSVGVIIAALTVHLWHWLWADIAVSFFVAILTGVSALPLVKESLKILLEYAPESINPQEVENSLRSFPSVCEVEKLHIWTISPQKVMLCANLVVESQTLQERDRLLRKLQTHLERSFGIVETSIQLTSQNNQAAIELHPLFNQTLVGMLSPQKFTSID